MDTAALAAAKVVFSQHEASLLGKPGVRGAGIGDGLDHNAAAGPCIVLYVSEDTIVESWPKVLDGLPVCIVRGPPFEQQQLPCKGL